MEVIKTALRSLMSNRTRSILTMLGIIIGVGAVITMVAIGKGASNQVEGFVSNFGANLIIVMPAPPNTTGARGAAGSGDSLTLEDAVAIADESFAIERVAPEVSATCQVVYGNSNWNTSVLGTTDAILPVRTFEVADGIFFSDSDIRSGAKVCVLGKTVAKELFGYSDPLDTTIRIRNIPFRVIGVLKAKGANSWGQDQDDTILVPVTTAQRRLVRTGTRVDTIRRLNVQAKNRNLVEQATNEVISILRQRHKLSEGVENDFDIRDMAQAMENATNTVNVMSMLLGAVASISLLVGGIGIMNIMLVSVSERTREIGIRMAVGARPSNVRAQFLTEAVVLSVLGGIMGISGGIGISKLISSIFSWPAIISLDSILLSVGFSAFVGIFFGFWPAWKASKLNPIDALRTD